MVSSTVNLYVAYHVVRGGVVVDMARRAARAGPSRPGGPAGLTADRPSHSRPDSIADPSVNPFRPTMDARVVDQHVDAAHVTDRGPDEVFDAFA